MLLLLLFSKIWKETVGDKLYYYTCIIGLKGTDTLQYSNTVQ